MTLPLLFLVIICVLILTIFSMIKTGIQLPILSPRMVKWGFFVADVVCFLVQCTGGGLSAYEDTAQLGIFVPKLEFTISGGRILLAGLALALAVFVFFLACALFIHYQIVTKSTVDLSHFKIMNYVIFIDMILLITRNSYRVAEFSDLHYHSPISTNEHLFFALDAALMLFLNSLWIPFHPGLWGIFEDDDADAKDTKKTADNKEDIEIPSKA